MSAKFCPASRTTRLARATGSGCDVFVLVLDFHNAFMTIPAHKGELHYNCCSLEEAVQLKRAPLEHNEPTTGKFVVWRTLGFGGRSFPLLYARVASFVARATQALLHHSACDT